MRARTVRHLTGSGLKNVWVNRLMSIASIGVLVACMVIIGAAILLSKNADKAMDSLEEQNVIMVYLNDENAAFYNNYNTSADNTSTEQASSNKKYSSSEASSEDKDTSSEEISSTVAIEDTNGDGVINQEDVASDKFGIHNAEEAEAFVKELKNLDNVKNAEYIPKEQGLNDLVSKMDSAQAKYFSFLDDDEFGNPLSDAVRVTIKDNSKFQTTIDDILSYKDKVDSVQSQAEIAKKITTIRDAISKASIWIIIILMIISLVIVSNTIRVTMYNRKLEISIMKAVGATNSFVRLPFVIEGISIGLISALLSTGIVYLIYSAVRENLKDLLSSSALIPYSDMMFILFGVFAAIGIFSGLFGSIVMISKYLRKEGSEFSAY